MRKIASWVKAMNDGWNKNGGDEVSLRSSGKQKTSMPNDQNMFQVSNNIFHDKG